MSSVGRFSTCRAESGEWTVVSQTRDNTIVLHSSDGNGANLIAALMNGDLATLATASAETFAHCYDTVRRMLGALRPRGRPAVGSEVFPQI